PEVDVVRVVDVPPVGRPGADAVRVVVVRVVARHRGRDRPAAARYLQVDVVEQHVRDLVAAGLAPDRRAVRPRPGVRAGDVVVRDVADVPDGGGAAASQPG